MSFSSWLCVCSERQLVDSKPGNFGDIMCPKAHESGTVQFLAVLDQAASLPMKRGDMNERVTLKRLILHHPSQVASPSHFSPLRPPTLEPSTSIIPSPSHFFHQLHISICYLQHSSHSYPKVVEQEWINTTSCLSLQKSMAVTVPCVPFMTIGSTARPH